MLFRNFCLSEYSEENIEFWIACEEYKKLKARQYPQKAASIYAGFVTVHAPKEVNAYFYLLFLDISVFKIDFFRYFWNDYAGCGKYNAIFL